jgi:hypothetical protein
MLNFSFQFEVKMRRSSQQASIATEQPFTCSIWLRECPGLFIQASRRPKIHSENKIATMTATDDGRKNHNFHKELLHNGKVKEFNVKPTVSTIFCAV